MKSSILVAVILAAFAKQTICASPDTSAVLNTIWSSFGQLSKSIISNLNSGSISGNYSTEVQQLSETYANATRDYAGNVSSLYLYYVQNSTYLYANESAYFLDTLTNALLATTVSQKIQVISELLTTHTQTNTSATILSNTLLDLIEVQSSDVTESLDNITSEWKDYATTQINAYTTLTNNDTEKVAKASGLINSYVGNAVASLTNCASSFQQGVYNLAANINNSVSRFLTATLGLEASLDECLLTKTSGSNCQKITNSNRNTLKTAGATLNNYEKQAVKLNATDFSGTDCVVKSKASFQLGKLKLGNEINKIVNS